MSTKAETSKKTKPLPAWNLILVNDNSIDISHVVTKIQEIVSFSQEDAVKAALEAHTAGRSLLLTSHLERVELYQEQFSSCLPPVPTKIEPA